MRENERCLIRNEGLDKNNQLFWLRQREKGPEGNLWAGEKGLETCNTRSVKGDTSDLGPNIALMPYKNCKTSSSLSSRRPSGLGKDSGAMAQEGFPICASYAFVASIVSGS